MKIQKIQKEKLGRVVGYGLFALAAFVFFFYRTFPLDALERQALKRVEAKSGCRIQIAQRRLGLPLRLSGRGITASCPKGALGADAAGRMELKITALDVGLSPLPFLLQREARIDFRGELGGGTLSGTLSVAQGEAGRAFDLQSIQAKQVNLSEAGLGTFGQLSNLQGEGAWLEKNPSQGGGRLQFILEQGRFSEIGGWPLPLGEIAYTKAEAQLSWQDGRIAFDRFSVEGDMADVQGERGSLLLRHPMDASLLTLALRATPKGALKEMAQLLVQGYNGRDPLTVRVSGALRSPQLSVNGTPVPLGT